MPNPFLPSGRSRGAARPSAAPASGSGAAPSAERLSDAIGAARVLAIFGIVYVHAWTGLPGHQLAALDTTPQGVLRWLLMELLGRSAVPLLGMVSGYLVASSALKRPYGAFMAGKARTILLPMVLWNVIAIVLVSGAAWLGLIRGPVPSSFEWMANELLSLMRPNHINVQMPFLRDLLVCMLLAPLLVRLPSRALVLVAVLAGAWTVSGVFFPLLLRPMILVFFVCGILARRGGWERRTAAWSFWAVAGLFVALALVRVWMAAFSDIGAQHPHLRLGFILLLRFAAALFIWRLAWAVAGSRFGKTVLRFEPYIFLMFCAHLIMMWLGGPAIGILTGRMGSPLYPVFLVLQPLLVLFASVLLGRALMAVSPRAALVLSGGRLKPRPADGAIPAAAQAPAREDQARAP